MGIILFAAILAVDLSFDVANGETLSPCYLSKKAESHRWLCPPEARSVQGSHAKLPPMPLILILIVLLIVFGGGGYYMGPGIGYYGGGGISLILALIVIYLLFGRGRTRL